MEQRLRDIDDWRDYARYLEARVCSWQEKIEKMDLEIAFAADVDWDWFVADVAYVIKEAADRAERLREKEVNEMLKEQPW